jgi:hypothetical protein
VPERLRTKLRNDRRLSPFYPRPRKPSYHRSTSSNEGRFREALPKRDGARRPRLWFATEHPGGTGAPPGPNTRPCQELAEVADLALLAFGLVERGIKD